MNAKVLIVLILGVIVMSCNKNSSGKQSNLSFVSVSSRTVNLNGTLAFNLNFSHPYSGTYTDTLGIKIHYKTCTIQPIDTVSFVLPVCSNTANQTCKLEYDFTYGGGGTFALGCSDGTNYKSDSAYFQFWLIDKNSVSSDTISTPMIFLNPN